MSHPFGDLITQYLHRKHGLSQSKLAAGILQAPSVITDMCQGKRLQGRQARERVVAIITWLHQQGALETAAEANTLLTAADMASLNALESVEERLLQQLDQQSNPSPTPTKTARHLTNLPTPLTSFIGRTQELVEVTKLVASKRLVTLSGVGGIGKTRLALEVARQMLTSPTLPNAKFSNGVWLVELAALTVPDRRPEMGVMLVAQAIARLFDGSEQAGHATLDSLQEALADKCLLLVLDNCEHLVAACAEVCEHLLQHCWQLHIVTTSREELRIPGETLYPVLPLALPDLTEQTPERVLACASVQLFIDRMSTIQPLWKAQETKSAALVQICRQLDGIPLALELAAPLARNLSLTEIATQLNNQMALLTNGYRTAIPRHQTMHSALVWSYRLLVPEEQQVLAQASVFAGGWTLEAAQAVCGDVPSSAVTPATVATVLNQLSTKSLVLIEILNEQRRYRLLEPIRQFAHSQLVASGDQENIKRRHAFYFLTLAQQMAEARDTLEERDWLQWLEPERNNLRAVNSWAVSQNEAEFAQRFNGLLFPFWLYCSSATEARHWSEAVLALTTTESTPAARQAKAMALDVAGYAAISQGDYARALDYFERELPLYAENDDPRGIATSLRGCGFAAMQSGDLVQAQHYTAKSLVVSQKAQDHWGAAWSLFDLGYLALVRHELSQAQSLLEAAVVALREQGNAFGLYRALFALARVSDKNGDTAQARTLCHDALRIQQQMHYLMSTTEGLEDLAGIEAREQQPVRAARIFGAAQAHREAMGDLRYRHRDVWFEHDLALARSQLDSNAWDAAWADGYAMTLEQAIEYALTA